MTDTSKMDEMTLASHMIDIGGVQALMTAKYALDVSGATDEDMTKEFVLAVLDGVAEMIVEMAAAEGREVEIPTRDDIETVLEEN